MNKPIRIGTRSSELALWQANTVAQQFQFLGYETEIVKIDGIGDAILDKPLYELGITGVFTKNLDIALINKQIDVAVHSLKDVPTLLPKGVVQAAVLKRGNHNDILVLKDNENFFEANTATIATGSLRRKAQWLYRYPNHQIVGLRGNVNTRLQKLKDSTWNGAIFAMAGLKRIDVLPKNHINLDWMIPAPAQGAVMVAALDSNDKVIEICKEINHSQTEICVGIERQFLRVLEGGCSAPIGALAYVKDEEVNFKGVLLSPDGKNRIEYTKKVKIDGAKDLGEIAANYILERGGKKIMRQEIKIDKTHLVFSTKNISLLQKNKLSPNIGVAMSDFITIKFNRLKPALIKSKIEHVVFTSQNAVQSVLNSFSKEELQFENIYCVGRRTKRLIERNIGNVNHVGNNAKSLAEFLVNNVENKQLTYFTGNLRRDELPNILSQHQFELQEIESYKTLLTPNKIEDKYKGVLFFSPSGIESYLQENAPNDKVAFCIGETTAQEAKKHFSEVITAHISTVENVLDCVNNYYQNKQDDK